MTAIIIDFRVHHRLKSTRDDYQDVAPRSARRAVRRSARTASADRQIAHIAWLLRELEEMARGGERLPQVLVAEAHASIERTRKMLQSWQGAKTNSKSDVAAGYSAQPNIDPALLERMYSDLGLYP